MQPNISKVLFDFLMPILTAAVLILSVRAVRDAVTAQDGRQAKIIQTLEMPRRTVSLWRNSAGHHSGTRLFIGPVCTIWLSVTPPALWDALKGVRALVLVGTTGHRLGSNWS